MNPSNRTQSVAEQPTAGFFASSCRLGRLFWPVLRRLSGPVILAGVTTLVVLVLLTACSAPSGGG